jgi:hypothetical protein
MAIFTEKGRTGDSSREVHRGEGRHGGLLEVWPEQAAHWQRDGVIYASRIRIQREEWAWALNQ